MKAKFWICFSSELHFMSIHWRSIEPLNGKLKNKEDALKLNRLIAILKKWKTGISSENSEKILGESFVWLIGEIAPDINSILS